MLIDTFYDVVELHRKDKILYAHLKKPHQVISTCRAAGGLVSGLEYVYNHQSCEPAGHHHRLKPAVWRDAEGYRKGICDTYGLPAESCATLGTAANMNLAAIVKESFRDLTVAAVCTGGVEANAGRAGDPASVFETPDGFETLSTSDEEPGPGTINTMIFINKPLIPGAMVRVIMTATEAKTAALQELAVNSRYSDGPATGTGTDQIAVASLSNDETPLTSAGKHAVLGQLIGRAVLKAVKKTLNRQNSLNPSGQCSSKIRLERFGMNRQNMEDAICRNLDDEHACLLRSNFNGIIRDPLTVASISAMIHVKDNISWGILPLTCWKDIMASCAANLACAVSGKHQRYPEYRHQLVPTGCDGNNGGFTELACRALALGFNDKWS